MLTGFAVESTEKIPHKKAKKFCRLKVNFPKVSWFVAKLANEQCEAGPITTIVKRMSRTKLFSLFMFFLSQFGAIKGRSAVKHNVCLAKMLRKDLNGVDWVKLIPPHPVSVSLRKIDASTGI